MRCCCAFARTIARERVQQGRNTFGFRIILDVCAHSTYAGTMFQNTPGGLQAELSEQVLGKITDRSVVAWSNLVKMRRMGEVVLCKK